MVPSDGLHLHLSVASRLEVPGLAALVLNADVLDRFETALLAAGPPIQSRPGLVPYRPLPGHPFRD